MFDLSTITRHGTRFEIDWLNAYNAEVIKNTPIKFLITDMKKVVEKKYGERVLNLDRHYDVLNDSYIEKVINYGKDRIFTLENLTEEDLECFWCVPDEKFELLNELLTADQGFSVEMLTRTIDAFDGDWPSEAPFDKSGISSKLKALSKKNKFNSPKLFKFLRAAVNDARVGPPVAEVFEILGRDIVLARLKLASKNIKMDRLEKKCV